MTVTIGLEITDETHAAMKQLADETGRESLVLLIQDGLRVYEWILNQQREGREIVSLTSEALALFASKTTDDMVRRLVSFVSRATHQAGERED